MAGAQGEESAAHTEYRTLPHSPEFGVPPTLDDRLMMEFVTWVRTDRLLLVDTILENTFPWMRIISWLTHKLCAPN